MEYIQTLIASLLLFLNRQPDLPPAPTPMVIRLHLPPSESLTGNIASMSGMVRWESRVATETAVITQPQNILQGERLVTDSDGMVTVMFEPVSVTLQNNSDLAIVQTLPANIVFLLRSGSVRVEATGTVPITVRALHALVDMSQGTADISLDGDELIITSLTAPVTYAYNNPEYKSRVKKLSPGTSVTLTKLSE